MMRQNRMSQRSSGNAPLTRGQLLALVLVFIVTALALLTLDRRNLLAPAESGCRAPDSSRSVNASPRLVTALRNFGARFGNVGELRAENERLQAENDRLRAADARVKAAGAREQATHGASELRSEISPSTNRSQRG